MESSNLKNEVPITYKIAKEKVEANNKTSNYNFAPKNPALRIQETLLKPPINLPIIIGDKKVNSTTFHLRVLNDKSKNFSKETKPSMTNAFVHGEKINNSTSTEVNQFAAKSPSTVSFTSHNEMGMILPAFSLNASTPINYESNGYIINKSSPHVTTSCGKENARQEMKKREEGLFSDISDIDNIDHFRGQYTSEMIRIMEMCEIWEKINEQTQLTDLAQMAILGVVEQARLLVLQKLEQFGTLVEQCANPESSAALVTPADLQGFWDVVFMQIENIDARFMKLSKIIDQAWASTTTPCKTGTYVVYDVAYLAVEDK